MRGAQEAALRFCAFVYLTNGRFVSEDEKPERAGDDAVLFCAIYQQSVMRGGAAEPVPCCYVARIAARARVTEDFLTIHSQHETEFVIVGMAAFAKNSIRNGEKQQFSRPVLQDANPGLRKNFDRAGRVRLDPGFGIEDWRSVGETIPRCIIA